MHDGKRRVFTRATDTAAARRLLLLRAAPRPGPHLGLALLQQRLQAFLRRPALVVVADQEDDVVPAVDAHHLEPHAGLVGVGRHGAQEAQVDALRGTAGLRRGRRPRQGARVRDPARARAFETPLGRAGCRGEGALWRSPPGRALETPARAGVGDRARARAFETLPGLSGRRSEGALWRTPPERAGLGLSPGRTRWRSRQVSGPARGVQSPDPGAPLPRLLPAHCDFSAPIISSEKQARLAHQPPD